MKFRYIFSTVALGTLGIVALSSCINVSSDGKSGWPFRERIAGTGPVTSDVRNLAEFTAVEFEGSYAVTLTQSDQPNAVTVHANANLLSHIKTEIKDGKLIVSTDADLRPTERIRVEVSSPEYRAIDIDGSADVRAATPINGSTLNLGLAGSGSYDLEVQEATLKSDIAGSGSIALRGNAASHTIDIAGSGNLIADKLQSKSAYVDVAGSGNATLFVTEKLDASIAGSGNVRYKGGAPTVHTSISGSGTVEELR